MIIRELPLYQKISSIRSAVLIEPRLVTDRQTDRHTTTANTAPAQRRVGKNRSFIQGTYTKDPPKQSPYSTY